MVPTAHWHRPKNREGTSPLVSHPNEPKWVECEPAPCELSLAEVCCWPSGQQGDDPRIDPNQGIPQRSNSTVCEYDLFSDTFQRFRVNGEVLLWCADTVSGVGSCSGAYAVAVVYFG